MGKTNSKCKKPGPNDWLIPFMNLRNKLRPFVEANVNLHHDVFLSGLDTEAHVSPTLEELEPWYTYRKAPVQIIPLQFENGAWAHHCFFGQDAKGFHVLTNELRDLMRWLRLVPENILPKFKKPRTKNREWRNVITWMSLLYYLAWKHQDEFLQAELLCSDSDVDLSCYPWDSSPAFPDCDPVSLITLTPHSDKNLGLWRPGGGTEEYRYPEFIEAFLTTDVLRASMTVVMLLKYYGTDPCEQTSEAGTGINIRQLVADMRRKKEREARRKRPNDLPMGLLGVLVQYHHKEDGTIIENPLGSEQIEEMMNLPQEKISRLMKQIFPRKRLSAKTGKERSRAKEQYGDLVAKGKLADYQSKLEREHRWNETDLGGRSVDSFVSRRRGSRRGRSRRDYDRDDE